MTGRALLLLLVLLAAATPAGAFGPREVHGDANLCRPVLVLADPGLDAVCPHARHEGVFTSAGCAEDACLLTLAVSSTGDGLPATIKSLDASLLVGEQDTAYPVCAARGADALACAGQTTVAVPLASGECVEARARTLLVELADVPPTLPVQADSLVMVCRAGDDVGIY